MRQVTSHNRECGLGVSTSLYLHALKLPVRLLSQLKHRPI